MAISRVSTPLNWVRPPLDNRGAKGIYRGSKYHLWSLSVCGGQRVQTLSVKLLIMRNAHMY